MSDSRLLNTLLRLRKRKIRQSDDFTRNSITEKNDINPETLCHTDRKSEDTQSIEINVIEERNGLIVSTCAIETIIK